MTAIKRKEKKGLFYLIAIAIMVAIMGISCSESPTTPANLSESGTGGGTDGGGAGIGGGTGTDGGYKVDVIYPDVAESLKNNQGIDINNAKESDLDTIWKALANERLVVTFEDAKVRTVSDAKNKNYFSFDAKGNMVSKFPGAENKIIKEFQKAVLVNGNNGYIIGGLYKVADITTGSDTIVQSAETIIKRRKIGFDTNTGNYEVVYINPQRYEGGHGYALKGSYSDTKNYSKDDFGITPDGYSTILKDSLNGLNPYANPSYNRTYSRFYR